MALSRVEPIQRVIHYYEIKADFDPDFKLDDSKYDTPFQALLSKVTRLAKAKHSDRYQQFGEKRLFINDQSFTSQPGRHVVKGKLLSVRQDFFPEIMDTATDTLRDIEALEAEGIVETTHFIAQERNNNRTNKIKIALEHNQFGARITDLKYYLEAIGRKYGIVRRLDFAPLIEDELSTYKDRIGHVSEITLKVHRNNLPYLAQANDDLFGSLDAAAKHFEEEYLTVNLKYNVRQARKTPTSNSAQRSQNIVQQLVRLLTRRPNDAELFEKLEVKAEDHEKHDRIAAFDLLINKVKDTISVERRHPSKTLVSTDMFAKMLTSWSNLGIRI